MTLAALFFVDQTAVVTVRRGGARAHDEDDRARRRLRSAATGSGARFRRFEARLRRHLSHSRQLPGDRSSARRLTQASPGDQAASARRTSLHGKTRRSPGTGRRSSSGGAGTSSRTASTPAGVRSCSDHPSTGRFSDVLLQSGPLRSRAGAPLSSPSRSNALGSGSPPVALRRPADPSSTVAACDGRPGRLERLPRFSQNRCRTLDQHRIARLPHERQSLQRPLARWAAREARRNALRLGRRADRGPCRDRPRTRCGRADPLGRHGRGTRAVRVVRPRGQVAAARAPRLSPGSQACPR